MEKGNVCKLNNFIPWKDIVNLDGIKIWFSMSFVNSKNCVRIHHISITYKSLSMTTKSSFWTSTSLYLVTFSCRICSLESVCRSAWEFSTWLLVSQRIEIKFKIKLRILKYNTKLLLMEKVFSFLSLKDKLGFSPKILLVLEKKNNRRHADAWNVNMFFFHRSDTTKERRKRWNKEFI